MTLKEQISEAMKAALRAKQTARLSALRLLLAAIKQREIDERVTLTDTDVLAVIEKMLKQRRDSISQFEAAGRQDLADAEKSEIDVLSAYLPKAMTDTEIEAAVTEAVAVLGAKVPQDMGKVMAALRPKLMGRADMAKVSQVVKTKLAL